MDTFPLAHSERPDSRQALDDCLQQLAPLPDDATLGFVYATDMHAGELGDLLRRLKEQTEVTHWIGTVGMGICCTRTEYFQQPALAIMLTDFDPARFHIFNNTDALPSLSGGVHLAIVHGDPRNGELPKLIQQLPDTIGNGYLVGGLTSSNSHYYQIADDIVEGQLSGVVFEDDVRVVSGLTQGCTPTGPIHELTSCDGNIALQIDDRPALEVMKEDIGEVLARDLQRIGGYIFVGFPVPESDTGDYLVRNLQGFDPNSGALAIGDYLQPNVPIMFCRRDGRSAVEDLERMVKDIQSRLPGKPKGGVYYTCLGRGQHMFGEPSRELEIIADIIGDVPLIGFYANGEIAGNRLYGYTGVLTLFS
jgi:small ligand-binding sensory domain FIST